MILSTGDVRHDLRFLQNTYVAGDVMAVFGYFLGLRFTVRGGR